MRPVAFKTICAGIAALSLFVGHARAVAPAPEDAVIRLVTDVDFTAAPSLSAAAPGALRAVATRPDNHRFADAIAGTASTIERLTLGFARSTRITSLRSSADFHIEQGSSCIADNVYSAGSTCTLFMRFIPQGAGPRLGRLSITHTAAVTPFSVGLTGNGYAPVVSFTPATIGTVAGTFPSNKGLLNGARNLAVDGGDTLYVADTGNNLIRMIDASNAITTISNGSLAAPNGIAVDAFGEVYFSETAANLIYEIFDYGSTIQLSGSGTDSCTTAATCSLSAEKVYSPGAMSIDPYGQLFFADSARGAAVANVQPYPATLARLYDPFSYQTAAGSAVAVDANDRIYTSWTTATVCELVAENYSDAANSRQVYAKVAGGRTCGYAGDGGQARNAEIGSNIGQIAFDVAGNLYFTDSANQRVRRIDAATGVINTIAGNGSAGYSGDGGPATSAQLSTPTGVGVDSQGQVYVISTAGTSGSLQVVRKLGTAGLLAFGNQARGSTSSTRIVTVANTGNAALAYTKSLLTGANAGDFAIDPAVTSCDFSAGATLAAGQSCKVGFVFKPTGAGARSASLVLLDNTVTNSNTINLSGNGTLPSASFAITAPAAGSSVVSGTTVKFSVSVTSTSTAPTGKVQFSVDGAAYGAAVAVASGAASTNVTGLTVKAHTLSATYSGDANYAPGGPISVSLTVKAATVKVTVPTPHPIVAPTGL